MAKKKKYVDLKNGQCAVLEVPKSFYGIGEMEITLEYHFKMKEGIPFIVGSAWVRKKGHDVKYRFYKFQVPEEDVERDSYRGSLFFHLSDNEEYLRMLDFCYNTFCDGNGHETK